MIEFIEHRLEQRGEARNLGEAQERAPGDFDFEDL
jgi:hypothetical protein